MHECILSLIIDTIHLSLVLLHTHRLSWWVLSQRNQVEHDLASYRRVQAVLLVHTYVVIFTCPSSMRICSVLPKYSLCSLLVNLSQNLLAVTVKMYYLNPCTQGEVCAMCVCVCAPWKFDRFLCILFVQKWWCWTRGLSLMHQPLPSHCNDCTIIALRM